MKSTSISKKDWKRPKTDVWFPTQTCPTTIANSANFEQDLYIMIKNTEFKFVSKNFQRQINDYIKTINSSDKVFVSADKSRNIYKMNNNQYTNLFYVKSPMKRFVLSCKRGKHYFLTITSHGLKSAGIKLLKFLWAALMERKFVKLLEATFQEK